MKCERTHCGQTATMMISWRTMITGADRRQRLCQSHGEALRSDLIKNVRKDVIVSDIAPRTHGHEDNFTALLKAVQTSLKETDEGLHEPERGESPGDDFQRRETADFVDRVERSDNRKRLLSPFRKSSRKR